MNSKKGIKLNLKIQRPETIRNEGIHVLKG